MNHENMKMTEIGWIPKNWECKQLEGCSFIKARIGWQGLTKSEYLSYGTYYLVGGTNFENGRVNWNTCSFVTKERYEQDKYIQIRNHDVLISKDGTIGKVAYVNGFDGQGTLNSGVFVVRPKSKDIDQGYFAWSFLSMYFDDFIARLTAGSTIKHLYQKDLVNFQFPLPSKLSEQRRIAQVLSDTDSLIASLVRTIEKKRLVKQGAMQQLLTGKTRLKGFSGEWVEKKLSDFVDVKKGFGLSKAKLSQDGQYRCILYGELFTTYDYLVRKCVSRTNYQEGIPSKIGDVLMPGSTTTNGIDLAKAVSINSDDILLGGDVIILRSKNGFSYDSYFLSCVLTDIKKKEVEQAAQGITIIHLNAKELANISINLPNDVREQTAISERLRTMDNEIASLEAELQKYKALKQGMMQKLLTGQIRLKVCQDTNT